MAKSQGSQHSGVRFPKPNRYGLKFCNLQEKTHLGLGKASQKSTLACLNLLNYNLN